MSNPQPARGWPWGPNDAGNDNVLPCVFCQRCVTAGSHLSHVLFMHGSPRPSQNDDVLCCEFCAAIMPASDYAAHVMQDHYDMAVNDAPMTSARAPARDPVFSAGDANNADSATQDDAHLSSSSLTAMLLLSSLLGPSLRRPQTTVLNGASSTRSPLRIDGRGSRVADRYSSISENGRMRGSRSSDSPRSVPRATLHYSDASSNPYSSIGHGSRTVNHSSDENGSLDPLLRTVVRALEDAGMSVNPEEEGGVRETTMTGRDRRDVHPTFMRFSRSRAPPSLDQVSEIQIVGIDLPISALIAVEQEEDAVDRGVDLEYATTMLNTEDIRAMVRVQNELCPICHCSWNALAEENVENNGASENESTPSPSSLPPGTTVRRTVCNHAFCQPCISRWLQTSRRCPMCNTDLRQRATESLHRYHHDQQDPRQNDR